nr:MAG TPA: hypothetical protein [Caudoviricetes sp.]
MPILYIANATHSMLVLKFIVFYLCCIVSQQDL